MYDKSYKIERARYELSEQLQNSDNNSWPNKTMQIKNHHVSCYRDGKLTAFFTRQTFEEALELAEDWKNL